MATDDPACSAPDKPEPVPISFQFSAPHAPDVPGHLTMRPNGDGLSEVLVDVELVGVPMGTVKLSADGALDTALRLVESVMRQRKQDS